jgi:hypothetical protein
MSTSKPLELLHMDLFGPTTYASAGGNLYCLVIVDDFYQDTLGCSFFMISLRLHIYSRSLPRRLKINLIAKSRRLEVTIEKNLLTPTFMNIVMRLGSSMKFLQHTHLAQQNGVVERKNMTLVTLRRTMVDEYNTQERFWVEVVNTACYTSNRLFPHRLLEKTPYELLNGKKPDVSFFRVFGCKWYIYKKRHHLGKFQRRCDIGFLLSYSSNSKAYRVFNHATGVI